MKIMMAALALLTISAASACGGTETQPTPTASTNAVSATSPAGHGMSTAGGGTNTSSGQTSATHSGSASGNSTTTEATTYNGVDLGPAFGPGPPVPFGRVFPGGSVTLPFQLHNKSQRSITIGTITTITLIAPVTVGDAAFSAGAECDHHVLEVDDRCVFSVTFKPPARGNYKSALSIAADSGQILSSGTLLAGSAGPPSITGHSVSPPASQLAPVDSSSSAPTGNSPP
jgi:hypothetical protein